jgi:hypothetical protein
MRYLREHERVQLKEAGMVHIVDRQDGVRECTRFRNTDGNVTAQLVEKRTGRDGVHEVVKSPEIVAGTILPLIAGFAAHVWVENSFVKLGAFDDEVEAFDAIVNRFDHGHSRKRDLHRA